MLEEAKRPPVGVLIVEDEAVTRKSHCLAVESSPELRLLDALDNVGAAVAWLKERGPDVLLVDLGLPDGSGLDVIRACAANWPAADIMVVSADSDEASVLSCIEAGASGYVLKNAVGPDLVRAILDLRQGGAPMSPAIARMVLTRIRGNAAPEPAPVPQAEEAASTRLTKRETVILDLIAKGQSYGEVARLLAVSVGTVQTHIKNIYGKLSVHSRGEAVFEAHKRGLLQFEQARGQK
ncbi:response regulator [Noviherbaspirillum aridicola]|uniref:DNA-binding response regulator n=1 Tax=Noviherbaspirillum aridicola TaxID=2849687 RepID=A0ABQ4Q9P4_9BURK|nr:response regulator transcription factor [Noviherbaspirillum aridicola]GIZ53485.1 DNA-binding response regulator [Noviherbaspirillum aridicola]